ncbi:MAG: hypothetical protein LBT04_02590 [Prevotellaceae bacterium]|nr:hypothetical protein [Prevotellaceae bacterium]
MKKSFLFIGLTSVVLMFAACGSKGAKQDDANDTISAECKEKQEFMEQWAKFDSLAVEEQETLIAKRVECFEKCLAQKAECKKDSAKCAEKKAKCTEADKAKCETKKAECEAKKAELDATWANFGNLTIAEKKAFFDKIDACKAEKKCCKKEGEEKKCCKKDK